MGDGRIAFQLPLAGALTAEPHLCVLRSSHYTGNLIQRTWPCWLAFASDQVRPHFSPSFIPSLGNPGRKDGKIWLVTPESGLAGKSLELPIVLRVEVCPTAQPDPSARKGRELDLIPPGCKAERPRKAVATSGMKMRWQSPSSPGQALSAAWISAVDFAYVGTCLQLTPTNVCHWTN